MRAVVTGARGFIGAAVVRALRARGDAVTAVLRSSDAPAADRLGGVGAEIVVLDLATADRQLLADAFRGFDAVFHLAGWYRIGIPASQHARMYAANVVATEAVLDAAIAAGVPRIVYASTGNVFGDTKGRAVDETYRRPQPPRFLSYYDETKYRAHLVAEARIANGAPVLIAIVGTVYGPGDHSQLGAVVLGAMTGRLPMLFAADLGGSFVQVDDLASGLALVHDRGELGEVYALGGELATVGEVVRRGASIGHHRGPLITIPNAAVRASLPLAPLVWRLFASEPDLAEQARASLGVTYWFSDAKARSQLGYAPRDLEAGLPTLLSA